MREAGCTPAEAGSAGSRSEVVVAWVAACNAVAVVGVVVVERGVAAGKVLEGVPRTEVESVEGRAGAAAR